MFGVSRFSGFLFLNITCGAIRFKTFLGIVCFLETYYENGEKDSYSSTDYFNIDISLRVRQYREYGDAGKGGEEYG